MDATIHTLRPRRPRCPPDIDMAIPAPRESFDACDCTEDELTPMPQVEARWRRGGMHPVGVIGVFAIACGLISAIGIWWVIYTVKEAFRG